jgi:hypothetical protein
MDYKMGKVPDYSIRSGLNRSEDFYINIIKREVGIGLLGENVRYGSADSFF